MTVTLERQSFPRMLPDAEANEKMRKNAGKAITEHRARYLQLATLDKTNSSEQAGELSALALEEEVALQTEVSGRPIGSVAIGFAETIGVRKNPDFRTFDSLGEDASCVTQNEEGTLAAIFDGHSGKSAAKYCAEKVSDYFFKKLREPGYGPHSAFEHTIDQLEKDMRVDYESHSFSERTISAGGCTAVLVYIDHKIGMIFTATVADSEAALYRKYGEATKAIPLSCIRDWGVPKEQARHLKMNPEARFSPKPKYGRFPYWDMGVNVSRTLGDFWLKSPKIAETALIHKCKITMQRVLPGDRIVVGSDGLWDNLTQAKIIEVLDAAETEPPKTIAEKLNQAIPKNPRDQDDITVCVIRIDPA